MKTARIDTIMKDLNHCQNLAARLRAGLLSVLILVASWLAMSVTQAAGLAPTNTPSAIPWNEIGAQAGADYQGDGLAVTLSESGARLHCVFQRLDGEATPEGLWLTSTVTNTVSDRFRVTAMAVGRQSTAMASSLSTLASPEHLPDRSVSNPKGIVDVSPGLPRKPSGLPWEHRPNMIPNLNEVAAPSGFPPLSQTLPAIGHVTIDGQTVRFSRAGLMEEYSVSMDGVRQDFVVEQAPPRPPGGELVVKLAVSGAEVEAAADGARLVLAHSGRKIAYNRLRVTDATGKELPARIEVCPVGDEATSLNSSDLVGDDVQEEILLTSAPTSGTLAVMVGDTDAVYPVRIDPTFSDANWVSLGGFGGANSQVNAAVTDGSGNLYIGGDFTVVGNTIANGIAEWNGSSWSALGSGMNSAVSALAVSAGMLYAGGEFTMAGTNVSAYAAQAYLPGSVAILTTNSAFGFTNGEFGFDVSGPFGSSVVIQASTDLQTWMPLQTNLLGSGPLYFSDAQSTANAHRFYRAQLSP